MNDGEAIMEAIIAEPALDLHRLAYADWLDDTGVHDRADFIRHQLAAAATGQVDCQRKVPSNVGVFSKTMVRCGRCKFCRPMRKAEDLFNNGNGLRFIGRMPFSCSVGCDHPSLYNCHALPDHASLYLWRGFIHTVRTPLGFWLDKAHAVLRDNPVERVEALDKSPEDGVAVDEYESGYGWFRSYADYNAGGHYIPYAVCLFLKSKEEVYWHRYPTAAEAVDDLSQALIAWGRARI
jgi:uncharacterized protein (TIGR02996 family)